MSAVTLTDDRGNPLPKPLPRDRRCPHCGAGEKLRVTNNPFGGQRITNCLGCGVRLETDGEGS